MSEVQSSSAEQLSFGEALAELEGIVASLESGSLELEESLSRYERGVGLLRSLQGRLNDAQQRVTVLLGELEAEAAEPETESGER